MGVIPEYLGYPVLALNRLIMRGVEQFWSAGMDHETQPLTDAEDVLIRKASKGCLEAFNQLVLRYQNIAYQHAYALTGEPETADQAEIAGGDKYAEGTGEPHQDGEPRRRRRKTRSIGWSRPDSSMNPVKL